MWVDFRQHDEVRLRPDVLSVYRDLLVRVFDPLGPVPVQADVPGMPLMTVLLSAALRLLRAGGFPVYQSARVVPVPRSSSPVVRVLLPTIDGEYLAVRDACQGALRLLAALQATMATEAVNQLLQEVLKPIRKRAPTGINNLRFLDEANRASIPWRRLHESIFQYGWGARARWLASSVTDRTPSISVALAHDKLATVGVLRAAGLPAPRQVSVSSLDQALAAADSLGYPVVVKPVNLEGGVGVMAGLKTPELLRWAFAKAKALSAHLLVEEHVEGRDYRLQVYNGQVHWVVERVPGGIVGDGVSSVPQLLVELNRERRPGGRDSILHPIPLDEEALGMLAEQGLDADSVIEDGRYVRLRRSANVGNGGVPLPCLEKAHPDNLALAIRTAEVMRLDVCGIDLLIDDIGVSWRQCRAGICEVNAQPQLSTQQAPWLLRQLVGGQGRIPVLLVLGCLPGSIRLRLLADAAAAGRCLGIADGQGVWRGETWVAPNPETIYQANLALVCDPAVDAMLVEVADWSRMGNLAVDRLDAVAMFGRPVGGAPGEAVMRARLATVCSAFWMHVAYAEQPASGDTWQVCDEVALGRAMANCLLAEIDHE